MLFGDHNNALTLHGDNGVKKLENYEDDDLEDILDLDKLDEDVLTLGIIPTLSLLLLLFLLLKSGIAS